MNQKTYHKSEIATAQLKTAVKLFLNNKDLSSVITLASAAGEILNQLVRNAGKEPFVDYACRVHNVIRGTTPPRRKYKNFINKILGIIDNKHMNDACSSTVKIDLHQCAVNTLIKSIADYVTLYGDEEPFIKLFLSWTWNNMDNSKIMETFKNMPKGLKK